MNIKEITAGQSFTFVGDKGIFGQAPQVYTARAVRVGAQGEGTTVVFINEGMGDSVKTFPSLTSVTLV